MPQDDVKISIAQLTELQRKCLEGFWNRRSAKQIASDLGISEAWVNKNLMTARRKLHVNSSADAAAIVFGGSAGVSKATTIRKLTFPDLQRRATKRLPARTEVRWRWRLVNDRLSTGTGRWRSLPGLLVLLLARSSA